MSNQELAGLFASVAGFILSLAAEIIPQYQALDDRRKRLVMLVALLAVAGGAFGLSCAGWLVLFLPQLIITCDAPGLAVVLTAFFSALVSNQGTFSLFFSKKKGEAPLLTE